MEVISSLGGRFGNLLFRLLTGRYMADRVGCPFTGIFEGNSLRYEQGETNQDYIKEIAPYFTNFNISADSQDWFAVKGQAQRERGPSTYTPILVQDKIIIDGNRHSPRYWEDNKGYVLEIFKSNWDEYIYSYIREKYSDVSLSSLVCINVRRGDFLPLGISIPPTWYYRCIQEFPSDTKFLVVSDDLEWCKQNFVGDRFIFADRGYDGFLYPRYLVDFYIQRMCKHNIIANSTFSWWAAYLNETEGRKVLYPWPWISWATPDFIPLNDNWIQITR